MKTNIPKDISENLIVVSYLGMENTDGSNQANGEYSQFVPEMVKSYEQHKNNA
jgi:hypothetical protein